VTPLFAFYEKKWYNILVKKMNSETMKGLISMSRQKDEASTFICTECGTTGIPVRRKEGKKRASGHLKHLHCIECNKKTNHVEITSFGLYQFEDAEREFGHKWKREN